MWLLNKFLTKFVREGTLGVIGVDGVLHRYGETAVKPETAETDPDVIIRITEPGVSRKVAMNPGLCFGEAYMDGQLVIEKGSLPDLLDICGRNLAAWKKHKRHAARWMIRIAQYLTQFNSPHRARRNVAHHYDLSHALYDTFLDRNWQYSCAYFPYPEASLDEAQNAKMRHIAAKLLLEPGQKVLDIGCGWGRFDLAMARETHVDVTGVTLSTEQLSDARAAAAREGLDERAHFSLTDYRAMDGRFDRIVSVGMFEHVGAPFYEAYFRKISDLMTEKGVSLIHTIGEMSGPGVGNPWISKYIFPGGYIPSLSEIVPAIEKAGLVVTDIEVLRMHYADTLKLWRERFLAHWSELQGTYDERFRRMWEFYLAACEMAFRHLGLVVFQIQLAKDMCAVPLTRDYIGEFEQRTAIRTAA